MATDRMSEDPNSVWLAPDGLRLPDFIICGAMKCGTSTLHEMLAAHPHVFMPPAETNFFDIDDIFQHSDFVFHSEDRWIGPDMESDPKAYWTWYHRQFESAPEGSVIGEDSTCYLPSAKAAQRIAMQTPNIKTIICLRHPTKRAYSQYWHMVRTGRALYSFEDTILFMPNYVLDRSMYFSQIQRFLTHIPRDRVFFFVLEEFLQAKERVLTEVACFLGLDPELFPQDAAKTWTNKATVPRSLSLQLFKNRMLRSAGNNRFRQSLPYSVDQVDSNGPALLSRALNKMHNVVNKSQFGTPPKLQGETHTFLDAFFRRELRGLDEIVGKDLESLWFK